MLRIAALLLLCVTMMSGVAHAAKMYKWVDDNGVTHFSKRQPPRVNADKTKLQGGNLNKPRIRTDSEGLAKVKRKALIDTGWRDCNSNLCQLVRQIDPDCLTSFCSRAKQYTNHCASAGCQVKKLAFETDMRNRVAQRNKQLRQQAINANSMTDAPVSQNQD